MIKRANWDSIWLRRVFWVIFWKVQVKSLNIDCEGKLLGVVYKSGDFVVFRYGRHFLRSSWDFFTTKISLFDHRGVFLKINDTYQDRVHTFPKSQSRLFLINPHFLDLNAFSKLDHGDGFLIDMTFLLGHFLIIFFQSHFFILFRFRPTSLFMR